MKIVKLRPSQRVRDRWLAFLEDGAILRLGSGEVAAFGLYAGMELSPELLDLGVKLELVQKSGSWFSIGETRIGQGRDAAKRYLQENPETADKLEADIRRNFDKLMSNQSRIAAKAAGRAVDVSADDFEDAD